MSLSDKDWKEQEMVEWEGQNKDREIEGRGDHWDGIECPAAGSARRTHTHTHMHTLTHAHTLRDRKSVV